MTVFTVVLEIEPNIAPSDWRGPLMSLDVCCREREEREIDAGKGACRQCARNEGRGLKVEILKNDREFVKS